MGNYVPLPGFNQVFENQPLDFWFNTLMVRKERKRQVKYGVLIGRHIALSHLSAEWPAIIRKSSTI